MQTDRSPAESAIAVTPSDTTVFAPTRALYVGTGELNVAVRMFDGRTVTFVTVASGAVLPIRVDKVLSTGTTASNIVALY